MLTLPERLRESRRRAELTVRDLADRLGKTAGYISRIENGREIPSPELLCQIADVLNVPAEELLDLVVDAAVDRTKDEMTVRCSRALALYRKSK